MTLFFTKKFRTLDPHRPTVYDFVLVVFLVDLVITSRWTSWVCLNRAEEWNDVSEQTCLLLQSGENLADLP